MARSFLPLGLKEIMDAAAPVDRGAQIVRRHVASLVDQWPPKLAPTTAILLAVHFRTASTDSRARWCGRCAHRVRRASGIRRCLGCR